LFPIPDLGSNQKSGGNFLKICLIFFLRSTGTRYVPTWCVRPSWVQMLLFIVHMKTHMGLNQGCGSETINFGFGSDFPVNHGSGSDFQITSDADSDPTFYFFSDPDPFRIRNIFSYAKKIHVFSVFTSSKLNSFKCKLSTFLFKCQKVHSNEWSKQRVVT